MIRKLNSQEVKDIVSKINEIIDLINKGKYLTTNNKYTSAYDLNTVSKAIRNRKKRN